MKINAEITISPKPTAQHNEKVPPAAISNIVHEKVVTIKNMIHHVNMKQNVTK